METKNIILIAIAVLVVALIAIGVFSLFGDGSTDLNTTNSTNITKNTTNITSNTTTNDTQKNPNDDKNNTTNKTYKVYNPQTDSYVEVIGEAYDKDNGRWYTYDADGVRYYNTRIWA